MRLFILAMLVCFSAHARDVVITTDCGADIDDQWAMAHMLMRPDLHVVGIVAGFAPAPFNLKSSDVAACVRETLAHVPSTVPVIAGASSAMSGERDGAKAIEQWATTHSSSDRLTIAMLGPATDTALALRDDADLAARVEVVALAFDRYPEGGDGWNVMNDPEAWRLILDSETPVTAVSGFLAKDKLNISRADCTALMAATPRGQWFSGLQSWWLDKYGEWFKNDTGPDMWPIWDEAVTAALIGLAPSEERARPALAPGSTAFKFPNTSSHAPFRWATDIDRAIYQDFVTRLAP